MKKIHSAIILSAITAVSSVYAVQGADPVVYGDAQSGGGVIDSVMLGTGNQVSPDSPSVVDNATLVGRNNHLHFIGDMAISNSTLVGSNNEVTSWNSTAVGNHNHVADAGGIAIGNSNTSTGYASTALGGNNTVDKQYALAMGYDNAATGYSSTAIGQAAKATAEYTIANGSNATASGQASMAQGLYARSEGPSSIALGYDSKAKLQSGIAIGYDSNAENAFSIAIGGYKTTSSGDSAIAMGYASQAKGDQSLAFGTNTVVEGNESIAIGKDAQANLPNSIALGAHSMVTHSAVPTSSSTVNGVSFDNFAGDMPAGVLSIGNNYLKRQLTGVAAGQVTEDSTDVVNGSQLYATQKVLSQIANNVVRLGGDSGVTDDQHLQQQGGIQFDIVKGSDYVTTAAAGTNVSIDLSDRTKDILDNAARIDLSNVTNATVTDKVMKGDLVGTSSIVVTDGASKLVGGSATIDLSDSVKKSLADTETRSKDNDVRSKDNEARSKKNEAAIKDLVPKVDKLDKDVQDVNDKVDALGQGMNAIDGLSRRMDKMGSQAAALAALKPIQYDPTEPTQIMVGYGYFGGRSAAALGVAHYQHESLMFHGGAAWGGDRGQVMTNLGITWKVGNKGDEEDIAPAFRKGPISSSAVLQDKVLRLETQNQQQQEEIATLKAQMADLLARLP